MCLHKEWLSLGHHAFFNTIYRYNWVFFDLCCYSTLDFCKKAINASGLCCLYLLISCLFLKLYKYFRWWWVITVPINAPFNCLYLHQPYTHLKATQLTFLPGVNSQLYLFIFWQRKVTQGDCQGQHDFLNSVKQ